MKIDKHVRGAEVERHLTWQRLGELHVVCDMPWMALGDLNQVMHPFENARDI